MTRTSAWAPAGRRTPVTLPNGFPGWLVTSYTNARRLLADPRLSKDITQGIRLLPPGNASAYASPLVKGMLTADPPDHTRLRRLVNKAFTTRAVERLRPRIERAAAELLDAIPAGSTVDLLDAYALPLPIIVICELLGVPAAEQENFRTWTLQLVSISTPEEAAEATRRLTTYLSALIDDKRANPAGDLLSELVRVSDEGSTLSPPEILNTAFLLLTAGFETAVNPHRQQRARATPAPGPARAAAVAAVAACGRDRGSAAL